MIRLALAFVVAAVLAGVVGFGGIPGVYWEAAKIFLILFVSLAMLSCLGGAIRGHSFWHS
jgi:uncharacterized membrane protein YtjA (UPF0391 family)